MCNTDASLMGLISGTEELEIYGAQTIQELIQFKWENYAFKHHVVGCTAHLFYMLILIIYTNLIYIKNEGTD